MNEKEAKAKVGELKKQTNNVCFYKNKTLLNNKYSDIINKQFINSKINETDEQLKNVGFKIPEYIINNKGIQIYLGNENKNDWMVVIPSSLLDNEWNELFHNKPFVYYCLTKTEVYEIIQQYN